MDKINICHGLSNESEDHSEAPINRLEKLDDLKDDRRGRLNKSEVCTPTPMFLQVILPKEKEDEEKSEGQKTALLPLF